MYDKQRSNLYTGSDWRASLSYPNAEQELAVLKNILEFAVFVTIMACMIPTIAVYSVYEHYKYH